MTESEATMNDEINDDEQQLIKLCLKKPKRWNWELTTSKSSSNITFPMIQLYDEKGNKLLAEANEAGMTSSSKLRKSASVSRASSLRSSKSSNGYRVITKRESIEEIILNPIITEPDEEIKQRHNKSPTPVKNYIERSVPLKDSNSKELKRSNTKPYSRSSSNSMRSRSSVSILERISELKRSSSSDESDADIEIDDSTDDKKYSIRRGHLGTLIIPKQDLSNVRRRPKRNNDSSGEIIQLISNRNSICL